MSDTPTQPVPPWHQPGPSVAADVPENVTSLAESQHLGRVLAHHGEPGPGAIVLVAGVVAAVSCGILGIITLIGWGVLRPFAILALAGIGYALVLLVKAVRVAVTGKRIGYVCEHGLVYRRRRRLRAVRWADVSQIHRGYAGRDRSIMDRYEVYVDGEPKPMVVVAGTPAGPTQPFIDVFERVIAERGITTEREALGALLGQVTGDDAAPGRGGPQPEAPHQP